MTFSRHSLSRRDFLKLTGLGLGALALRPFTGRLSSFRSNSSDLPDFPQADQLGRNCTADTSLQWGGTIPIKTRPDVNSSTVRTAHRNEVFPWVKEVSAETVSYNNPNQRWVDVDEGYIWSPYLQPCRNLHNTPLTAMPEGKAGFWGEVTVPYVELKMENAEPASGWMRDHVAYGLTPCFYYSQVMWIDGLRTLDNGTVQYHINERYGNPGDLFWADGAAFRPLTEEEIAPLSPDVDSATKKIVVNVNYQTLSCQEGDNEVYFCRVSTGLPGDSATPLGEHAIWKKDISIRMAANTVSNGVSYDLPGISWSTFFVGTGVAIHGATSHNDFGAQRSHGCVNCRPEDAKWIFRWTMPAVTLDPGQEEWSDWRKGSTHVTVVDNLY